MFGYAGTVLRVDLSSGKIVREELSEEIALKTIGGRGMNSVRLYNELPANTDPLSAQNMLIFGVGPLTGSPLFASSRLTVTAKSPLTDILGDSNAGGHLAPEIKYAGYDQIVITGASERWCYLSINDDKVQIKDATHLHGMDIVQATQALKAELHDDSIQVAVIGQASENLVKFGGISCNLARIAARTGMGTVMGSKKIKAIAVKGTNPVRLNDPKRFAVLNKEIERRIEGHREFYGRKRMGTTQLMYQLNSLGILPTRNFKEGQFEHIEQVTGQRLANEYNVKNKACFNCNLPCSRYFIAKEAEGEGPEYETLCGFTSRIGCNDIEFALKMTDLCNRVGIDTITLTGIIGWVMECFEEGLLAASDLDGIEMRWGDTSTVEKLTRKIIVREGVGAVLAEGSKKAARIFGRGTERFALHVKGLEIICGDPRGIKGYGLTYAIASRGGDHLRAEPFFELTGDRKEAVRRFGHEEAADRLSEKGKPELVEYTEKIALLNDSLTTCKNIGLCMDILDFDSVSQLLIAGTGIDFTPERLDAICREVIDTERRFNLREGMLPAEDTLPERFVKEPLKSGPSAGQVVNIDEMVNRYYDLRGWKDGHPGH